jgi:hypothetical protein
MKLEDQIRRFDELLELAKKVQATEQESIDGLNHWYHPEEFNQFRTSSIAHLLRVFGKDSHFSKEFGAKVNDPELEDFQIGLGILKGARDEVVGGWLHTTRGLISAEIFSDFIEMAGYLLTEGYKDPAAVIIGSTLEEHLRQLCGANGLDTNQTAPGGKTTPKKADVINAELQKAGVYGMLDQKQITAWLDLRNRAAHGRYGEYTKEHVELMHQGVLNFMARVHP